MTISNWWPLALLILIPIIILLYMLKQKAQEYPFSSSMLWREIYNSIEATKPWEKLKKNLLMFLQIFTVLLLIFALMAPYLKQGGRRFDNVVIVVDTSASMGIQYNNDRTRLEEAVQRACDYVDSLNETAQVTILTSNQETGIIKTNVTDKAELRKALKALLVTDLSGDTGPAVSVVQSMANQWEQYEAVFFTDTPVELGNLEAQVINLYTDYENLSMDYVSYGTEYDENGTPSLTVIAKITSDAAEDVITDVNLYGDNNLLMVQSVQVPAGGSQIVYFNQVNFGGDVLMAEINSEDDLVADNKAYAAMNAEGQKRVLLVTNDNMFLEKAIINIPWVDLYKTNQLSAVGKDETFDLYIFDGMMPETLPAQGNIIYMNPSTGNDIKASGAISNVNLEFVETEITKYVTDFSFGVSVAKEYERPIWADSFISSGTGCAGYFGENDGRRIAVIGFDIHYSDLALQAEFPILISNLMEYMMVSGMVSEDDYAAGDKIVFNGNLNGSDITVTAPDGDVTTLAAAVATSAYADTNQAGVYSVAQTVDEVERKEYFVVRFPIELESHQDGETVEAGETVGEDEKNLTGGRDLRNIIILLILLALAVEWFVYVRQH
ncbi:MAG: BatA and WFA domain-containing protein [Lachnospiraceae bacterium]|nr:BatA and WFA domain-containing protein [Lachnospiraceae bacterium]